MAKNVVSDRVSQVHLRMPEEDQTWVGLLTIHLKMTFNLPGQQKCFSNRPNNVWKRPRVDGDGTFILEMTTVGARCCGSELQS